MSYRRNALAALLALVIAGCGLLQPSAWSAATIDRAVCSTADKSGGDPLACSATELIDSTTQEIAKLYQGNILVVQSVSGTNTITGSTSPVATALSDGEMRQIKPANNNTGAVTYNDNGLGAKQVVSAAGSALGSGDLQSTTIYIFRYYAANDEWRVLTTLGTGTASASNAYVTIGNTASLSAERALTAGTALGLTDGGANSTATIALTDAELTCLAALTSAADKLAYYTGSGTCALTDLPSFARNLIDDTSASAARTTLGLVLGVDAQAYDADLAALAANSTTGFWAYTGAGTGSARTLTAPAAGLTITNPAGTAGNPTFALANDLSALEGLSSTGIAARTGSDTWAQRTITGTANEITATNGDGVSGNPTLSLPSALTFTGKTVTGGTFSGPTIGGTGATFNGSTSGTTTLAATATAGTTALTLPAATDTLVGKATTDTFTNKTISLGSNTVTATSAQVATAVSDETGSGKVVFDTSPTLTTPNLGTPSAVNLSNGTALPISGINGLGTGVATALAVNKNTTGGIPLQSGTPTSGNCARWAAGGGLEDSGGTCGGGGGGGSPGGSSGQIQYNNAGAFGGFTASGDATINTGTGAVTIANDAVTYAKMQNVGANSVLANNTGSSGDAAEVSLSASQLLGRGSSGNVAAISLGSGLSMSGTTLNASGGLVYIGSVMGTSAANVDLALGGTYSKILAQCSVFDNSAGTNSATVAVSDDNGSTYGTGLTFNTDGTALGIFQGSFEISGTGTAATNKVLTPTMNGSTDVDGTPSGSNYTTTATESTKTGVTTHLRFVSSTTSTRYNCTVYGIP